MKKLLVLSLLALLSQGFSLSAQDKYPNGRALNIPFKKYGICFGNSHEFNGIRINFADKDVKRITGLNVTLWIRKFKNKDAVINGISIGVIPTAGSMQPINIGLLGVGTAKDNLNGLSIAGLGIGTEGNISGVAACFAYLSSKKNIRGIGVTLGYLESNKYIGLAIAGYSSTKQMNGLSVAILNRTEELHGIQIGLWNYAENNRKGFKKLPLFNFHFKRKQQTD